MCCIGACVVVWWWLRVLCLTGVRVLWFFYEVSGVVLWHAWVVTIVLEFCV